MTMNAGLACALRRFLGVSAMMLAGQAGMHDLVFADPALPARNVNRVVVAAQEGAPHEITDPAAVRQIVRFVRSRGGDGIRARQICFWEGMNVAFFRGTDPRGGMSLGPGAIVVPARHEDVIIPLDPAEAAELRRLLRIAN